MKILYLCHRIPYPPNKGEKIRAYHHIEHLARAHRIHLACLADTREDLEHARALEKLCASVDVVFRSPAMAKLHALAALPTGRSISVAAFDSSELRRRVERRLKEERPDILVAYSAAMAQYVEHVNGSPRVLDFVDADSEKMREYAQRMSFPQSAIYGLEADRLARYEARMASTFDISIFVSEAEAEIVRRRAAGGDYSIIRNGVNLEAFRPDPKAGARPRDPVVVFTGVMGYFPNADAVTFFVRDILPLVRAQVPDARFEIVGRDPSAGVRQLARIPGVTVTGFVPDVRPYLANAALAVAPFRIARGVQNKVLEAMASGLPVVGTPLAFQGLAVGESDGVRVADTAEAFAGEVVTLLRDPALQSDLGQRARRYVERHHRWEEVGALLEGKLNDLVARGETAASRPPRRMDAR
jgi:sugar transferase (PEP-CTERM/EpsH1 system associated)